MNQCLYLFFNSWVVHGGVQGQVSELHTVCFLLWNILIGLGVANLDLWIISCWFGCSQHVSFALRFNICFYIGVIGSLSLRKFSFRCRGVGAVVKDVSLI